MTGPPAFDLRDEPWIPVRTLAGTKQVGLRDLFLHAHEIEDLAIPVPPAASGLMRILCVMTARISGLDDPDSGADEWLAERNAALLKPEGFDPGAVGGYFDRPDLADRFFLFGGERPFLQDPLLARQCAKTAGVNKLAFGRAAGNNHVWWGPHSDVDASSLSSAQAAWSLIAQHYYGPSGRCSARTVDGTSQANSTAGPLRKTISFHPLGHSLYQTLLLGIPRLTTEPPDLDDAAPWEEKTAPDPQGVLPPLTWPGRLLAGRSRHAVLLVPTPDGQAAEDAYVTWATRQPPLEAVDPYLVTHTAQKTGSRYPREADSNRALWRDLDALLLKSGTTAGVSRPLIFDDLNSLPDDVRHHVRVRAYGFEQDGQQVDRSWFTAVTPPLLGWLEERDPAMARHIADCRESAERHGDLLAYAVKIAWAEFTSPPPEPGKTVKLDNKKPGPWLEAALAEYWPRAETKFWQRIDSPGEAPRSAFLAEAETSLRAAVGGAERQMKGARAVSHALGILRKMSKETR